MPRYQTLTYTEEIAGSVRVRGIVNVWPMVNARGQAQIVEYHRVKGVIEQAVRH